MLESADHQAHGRQGGKKAAGGKRNRRTGSNPVASTACIDMKHIEKQHLDEKTRWKYQKKGYRQTSRVCINCQRVGAGRWNVIGP